ncbi:MAG: helix-turn-helix transcriptional regulator [Clostridiales bacterium]|nr:helix-turn-helix transcriptional regulator [Clostridiales bacterium]
MDQRKTGKFIAQIRKEKGLTQRELAQKLLISDKTVSKWECGNGLPEVALMSPLCEVLEITVNELLAGERLFGSAYQKKAEENIMSLIREREESKFRLIISILVAVLAIVPNCLLIVLSEYAALPLWANIVLKVVALVFLFGGIFIAGALEMRRAVFECKQCKKRFIPTKTAYIMSLHMNYTRRLKCPHCGKRSWCKRKLSFDGEAEEEKKEG